MVNKRNPRYQDSKRAVDEEVSVESIIYWRDVQKSAVIFGAGLTLLLAIATFSVISVVAYTSILILLATVSFRVYKTVQAAVHKTNEGHPFKDLLEKDIALPVNKSEEVAAVAAVHLNAFVAEIRRLFLVEDFLDSAKFAVLLYVLTYIGAWFNGFSLAILAYIGLFTVPIVYENNQELIDANLEIVKGKISEISSKVGAVLPFAKKAEESEKDK